MKKKILLISGGLLTFVIVITTIFIVNKNSTNNETVMKDKIINNNSFLTLMLEQSDGTYAESTSNTWPGKGYIFNKELSSCQNGSELSRNEELGAVTLSTTIADSCYIYFDLYNPPTLVEWVISQYNSNNEGVNGFFTMMD